MLSICKGKQFQNWMFDGGEIGMMQDVLCLYSKKSPRFKELCWCNVGLGAQAAATQ